MSNERLRSALLEAALTYQDVSEHVAVDPKTVERWVTQARVPHRTHRLKVASVGGSISLTVFPAFFISRFRLPASGRRR
jgi:hypothetical protein